MQTIKILKKEGPYLLIKQYNKTYIRYIADGKIENIFQIPATTTETYDILYRELKMSYTVDRKMRRSEQTALDYQIRTVMDYLEYEYDFSMEESARVMSSLAKDKDIVLEAYEYVLTGRMKKNDAIEVNGYTAIRLYKEHHQPEIACYLTMMALRQEPIITQQKLKESVRR